MRLLECQAKQLLVEHGIRVPKSTLLTLGERSCWQEIGFPVVLKAQVPSGGRFKAGGIRFASDRSEAEREAQALLSAPIRGQVPHALLVEERVAAEKELYLAFTIDRLERRALGMASSAGGVDVEAATAANPGAIVTRYLDWHVGLRDYQVRALVKGLRVNEQVDQLKAVIWGMHCLLRSMDALLVEINPLAVDRDGPIALDAKVLLDPKAEFRHAATVSGLREEQMRLLGNHCEAEMFSMRGVTFVPLPGDIAVISDGAGTGMLTLDLIQAFGGHPADFYELGGVAGEESIRQALDHVRANPRVKVVLVSLIGGLTRMDHVADGISVHMGACCNPVPLVVRMCGTMAHVGSETLRRLGLEVYEDLEEAATRAVALTRGGHGDSRR